MKELNKDIVKLMNTIKYHLKDERLLIQALTHRSYANEHDMYGMHDNERLEFLGDSVLDLISTEYIVAKYPQLKEGDMSKIKSQLISENAFSTIANEIQLGEYLFLSNGENATGGRKRKSILGDAFEALIGAIFLDSGDYYITKKVALEYLVKTLKHLDSIEGILDYKTELQEYIQSIYKVTPEYEIISATGPDHDKVFTVIVTVNGKTVGEGVAKNRKSAEKAAAKQALSSMRGKK